MWPGASCKLAVALQTRGVDVRVVAPSDGGQGGRGRARRHPVRRAVWRGGFGNAGLSRDVRLGDRDAAGIRSLARFIAPFGAVCSRRLAGAEGGACALVVSGWSRGAGSVPLVITCYGTGRTPAPAQPLDPVAGPPHVASRRRGDHGVPALGSTARVVRRGERVGGSCAADAGALHRATLEHRRWRGGGDRAPSAPAEALDLAIGGYAEARSHGLAMPFTIVGDGPARAALRTMVGGLGLTELVHFAGEVPPSRVPDFLARADCCLMTAEAEGLGLTAAEALMQGVPVVACHDGGGVLDVVPATGAGRVVAPTAVAIGAGVREWADAAAPAAAKATGEAWRRRLSRTSSPNGASVGTSRHSVGKSPWRWVQRVIGAVVLFFIVRDS